MEEIFWCTHCFQLFARIPNGPVNWSRSLHLKFSHFCELIFIIEADKSVYKLLKWNCSNISTDTITWIWFLLGWDVPWSRSTSRSSFVQEFQYLIKISKNDSSFDKKNIIFISQKNLIFDEKNCTRLCDVCLYIKVVS